MHGSIFNLLRISLFATVISTIAFAISCGDVGPVPQFEYTYENNPDLDLPDTTEMAVGEILFTEGSVNTAGYKDVETNIVNAGNATNYASAVSGALNGTLQTYWLNTNTTEIETKIASGDAEMITNVNSTVTAFSGNGTLSAFLPSKTSPTGTTTDPNARVGARGAAPDLEEVFMDVVAVEQDELDDCKQAAEEAYQAGLLIADSILDAGLDLIEQAYQKGLAVIDGKKIAPQTTIANNTDARKTEFLSLYNNIDQSITTLFGNGDITSGQRDQLRLFNNAIYGMYAQASQDIIDEEDALVDQLANDLLTKLNNNKTALTSKFNKAYDTSIIELQAERDQTLIGCHNQGGVNSK